jgi:dTDP-4-amino-4,6-dideoxygalactose transaminase
MKEVLDFERQIADFYGAPFAVATDSCTHAIELCLRYLKIKNTSCPNHTYISIPFTLMKLDLNWSFKKENWKDFYCLGNTNIIDAAVYWKKDGYVKGSYMCLSFQYRKHLNLGRGGTILLDNEQSYTLLKKMSYDGRLPNIPWVEQDIDTIGYHYYMTPETANAGIEKLDRVKDILPRQWSFNDYPDLENMKVFKNV